MGDNALREAALQIQRAIRDEGRVPGYHRRVMARHRYEWPILWSAIDRLLDSLDNDGRGPE